MLTSEVLYLKDKLKQKTDTRMQFLLINAAGWSSTKDLTGQINQERNPPLLSNLRERERKREGRTIPPSYTSYMSV